MIRTFCVRASLNQRLDVWWQGQWLPHKYND